MGEKSQQTHHWLAFVLVVIPTLLLATGVTKLNISADTRVLAGVENPVRLDLEAFEQRFAQNNNLFFVVEPANGEVFTPETLQAVEDITELAWQLPYVTRVDSITNFPLIVSDGDDFGAEPLSDAGLPATAEDLAEARAAVMAEPWLDGLLISRDGDVTAVNSLFILPQDATDAIAEIGIALDEMMAAFEADHPGTTVHITGNVALMVTYTESSRRDVQGLIPLSFSVVVLIAFIFLRDLKLFGLLVIYLSLCCLGAMGAAGWWGHVLNPATVTAPIIIMTLGLASMIHLLSGIQMARARTETTAEAVDIAMKESRNAIIITILTTTLGFLCMNFAASPPLRALGNIVAVGLGIALVLALYAIPPLLKQMDLKARTIPAGLLATFIDIVDRRRALILFIMISASAVAILGVMRIKADDDFIRDFSTQFEFRRASDFTEDHLTGLNILEFAFESGESHGINEPEYFERLDAFTTWLRAQPNVEQVTSMSDKLRQLNTALNPDADPGSLPDRRETIAQYLLLFELSLPAGSDIADRMDADRSATRVTAVLRHMTSADIREINARAEEWLAVNNPVEGQQAGHSINYLFAKLSLLNIRSMIVGTAFALVLISIIVIFALRDLRMGVVSLIANLLPPIVGFGIWGFAVGQVSLASSAVAAMTFGIVVDDTIHFLLRFKKERAKGFTEREAVRIAYISVGRAMIITSLALTGGFMMLIISGFEINSSLGLFTSIIVMTALILDLTLVPALLLALRRS